MGELQHIAVQLSIRENIIKYSLIQIHQPLCKNKILLRQSHIPLLSQRDSSIHFNHVAKLYIRENVISYIKPIESKEQRASPLCKEPLVGLCEYTSGSGHTALKLSFCVLFSFHPSHLQSLLTESKQRAQDIQKLLSIT